MKKLLLVIDMQIDFIDGALGTPEAEAIVDKVVEKMKTYPTANIIATRDTHTPDYLHTQEGRNLPVKHCIQGTLGWQLHPAVAAALGEGQIMDKPTFGSIDLMHQLAAENQQEPLALELVGLCTDICVVSNALLLKAAMPEWRSPWTPLAAPASRRRPIGRRLRPWDSVRSQSKMGKMKGRLLIGGRFGFPT